MQAQIHPQIYIHVYAFNDVYVNDDANVTILRLFTRVHAQLQMCTYPCQQLRFCVYCVGSAPPPCPPVICAARAGNADALQLLLSRGADINAVDRSDTAVLAAVEAGSDDCLDVLLEAGVSMNSIQGTFTAPSVRSYPADGDRIVAVPIVAAAARGNNQVRCTANGQCLQ